MARSTLTSLVLSTFFHGLLLTFLLSESLTVTPTLDRAPEPPSMLELIEGPTSLKGQGDSGQASVSPPQARSQHFDLGGDFTRQLLASRLHTSQDGPDDAAANGNPGHGWSLAVQETMKMDIQRTLETLPFFMALYPRINSVLVYPDDFSKQRIEGRVRIEAELNSDGTLKRFISSTTDDGILQTYCLAFLMQTLSQPLPQAVRLKEGETTAVSLEFEFHTRVVGSPKRTFATIIQKNHLAFGRENEVEPIVNERIEEFFSHYVPPIVPLPGGVYVDFVLAYKFVQNILNDAPTARELRQSKIEKLHEELRRYVRFGEPPSPKATPES